MDQITSFLKTQTKLQLLEHAVAAGACLYLASKIKEKGVGPFFTDLAVGLVKSVPGAQGLVDAETDKIVGKLAESIAQHDLDLRKFHTLPNKGVSEEELLELLKAMRGAETDFQTGRAFGGIYNDHHELNKMIVAAENIFHDSNGLFPTIFPGLRKMETEVIRMAANLLHGDANVVGSLTTGGTESILCAIKAYREKAEKERGVTRPELIFPDTAHPAFAKACDLFKVKMVILPVRSSDCRVDPSTVKAAINENTIAIVASAPTYPHGVVDPIEEIGSIAESLKIPFHVDACLGGFHLPFLTKLGLFNKKFDFAVPGVTSMTADLHKYGMGPKGTAVLLYRNSDLRKYQFYVTGYWAGGLYASPSMTGSRAGGSIAGAWATMVFLGDEGYMSASKLMFGTLQQLASGISAIPGLKLIAQPDACCIAFIGEGFDALQVADLMEKRGWKNCNRMQKPACVQLQVAHRSKFDVAQFLVDLAETTAVVRADPKAAGEGMAAIYSMAEKIPASSGITDRILKGYLDVLYR